MKKIIPLLLSFTLLSPAVHAADKPQTLSFWESLRMKVEQLTPQKKLSTTTAVGGVRGAPVETTDVYWKNEAKPVTIDPSELAAFQKAVALVDEGKKDQAQGAFADFAKKYPDSPLRKDAEQAITLLQAK